VDLLRNADALNKEFVHTQEWLKFVSDQRAEANDAVISAIDTLAQVLNLAIAQDPTLKQRYPQFLAFLQARAEVATKRGAQMKAKNAPKMAAKAAEQAAQKAQRKAAKLAARQAAQSGDPAANTPPASNGGSTPAGAGGK
jgi:hypothetical protein